MKQAEACGRSSMPTLKKTGLLNAARWWRTSHASSSRKAAASRAEARRPLAPTQRPIVSTTRPTRARTLDSRFAVPGVPAK